MNNPRPSCASLTATGHNEGLRANEVTPVFDEDYEAVSKFLAEFPHDTRTKDLWHDRLLHWWDYNPAYSRDIPRGWVIRDGDRIVGFLGNIPSLFRLEGRDIIAYNSTTWRVLPAYRAHSLQLIMRLIVASRDSILFETTPNNTVVGILEGLGFELIPGDDRERSYAFTSLEKRIQARLELGPTLRPVLRLITVLFSRIPSLRIGKVNSESGLKVRRLDRTDAGFDQLWERTKDQYQGTNVRTARILGWYCFNSPYRKKELFGCYRNDQLIGYAICLINKATRLGVLECLDLWTESGDGEATKALLLAAKEFARRQRCGIMSVPHYDGVVEEICRLLGMQTQAPVSARRYIRVSSDILPTVLGPGCYIVAAQGDYAL